MADAAQLEIRVLSEFTYRSTGAAWRPVPTGLVSELLYLLAVGGPADAGELCQALWPGAPQRWTTGRMIDVRARLRRKMGDVLVKDEAMWSLSDDVTACDLWDVEAQLSDLSYQDRGTALRHLAGLLRRYPHALDALIASPTWSTPATEQLREQAQERLDALRHGVAECLSSVDNANADTSDT